MQLIAGGFYTFAKVGEVCHCSPRLDLQGVRKCLLPQLYIPMEKL